MDGFYCTGQTSVMKILLLSALLLSAACAEHEKEIAVKMGNLKFLFQYLKLLCQEPKNVVFSPFSAHSALSMLYAGSGGTTREALAKTLNVDDIATATEGYEKIFTKLNSESDDIKISVANKVYVKPDHTLKPEFSDIIKNKFYSEVESIDFSANTEAAGTINSWVEQKTESKIKELFKPDDISVDTHIVLVNAFYFKGDWLYQFDPEATEESTFYLDNENKIQVPMMTTSGNLNYGENIDLGMEILELPFKNRKFSMLILLPIERDGISKLLETVSVTPREEVLRGMQTDHIEVEMPKFKISQSIDMEDTLKKMGLGELFESSKCDLTDMFSNNEDIYITKAIQKTYLDVNEVGCEAAAATGMIGVGRSLPRKTVKVDRPFIAAIIHKDSDTMNHVLLVARILNPSQ